jgi:hypothetical protein
VIATIRQGAVIPSCRLELPLIGINVIHTDFGKGIMFAKYLCNLFCGFIYCQQLLKYLVDICKEEIIMTNMLN